MAERIEVDRTLRASMMKLLGDAQRYVSLKILKAQGGVPTLFDIAVLERLRLLRESANSAAYSRPDALNEAMALVSDYYQFSQRPRYERYSQRATRTPGSAWLSWDTCALHFNASQGATECLSWRGLPLFKTVFDFAIYPMLISELKPSTIVELGSGTGASAVWFADLLRLNGINGRVYSVDLHAPAVRDPDVHFIQGDCSNIGSVLASDHLRKYPHPWLVIEDMHVNTLGVLIHFADLMERGDYIVVEDSRSKRGELQAFDERYGSSFHIDSRYCDFFGHNSTCSADSIFVKVTC